MTERIRIMVVEDHFLARLAIKALIGNEADLEVVAEAENGVQAVAAFRELRPDVVIMDLRLPGLDGVGAITAIRQDDPDACILVLSHYETDEDVRGAIAAGAGGYLRKDVDEKTLLSAIRTLAVGKRLFSPQTVTTMRAQQSSARLTRRETEILQMVFQGLSNRTIADNLTIAEKTVRIHTSNILHKLGAKRRTEAVAIALKTGLLRAD